MKKLFLTILILFITSPALAERYCQWDGSEGINCRNTRNGILRLDNGYGVTGEANINLFDFYKQVITEPTPGGQPFDPATRKKTDEVWSFANDEIGKTWNTEALTPTELDERAADAMDIDSYYLWKALIWKNVLTQAEAVQNLPTDRVDAYLARKRLLGD